MTAYVLDGTAENSKKAAHLACSSGNPFREEVKGGRNLFAATANFSSAGSVVAVARNGESGHCAAREAPTIPSRRSVLSEEATMAAHRNLFTCNPFSHLILDKCKDIVSHQLQVVFSSD